MPTTPELLRQASREAAHQRVMTAARAREAARAVVAVQEVADQPAKTDAKVSPGGVILP